MVYHIEYRIYQWGAVHGMDVIARSKAEAYEIAVWERLMQRGIFPYSAWVASVTYRNGNYKRFNTSEGNPY